jgi:hypothetical protein
VAAPRLRREPDRRTRRKPLEIRVFHDRCAMAIWKDQRNKLAGPFARARENA